MAANGRDGPASARVLAVTELTEMILGNLALDDIVHAQRTCKIFRDIIKTSKVSRRMLYWIPVLQSETNHFDDYEALQRFLTFDNSYAEHPEYSFRMWQSTSKERSSPITLRFHECFLVVHEPDTSVIVLQGASMEDLRRQILVDEDERVVEVRLKRKNSLEMVMRLPAGATLGQLYDKLCEMSMMGVRADFQQAFIN